MRAFKVVAIDELNNKRETIVNTIEDAVTLSTLLREMGYRSDYFTIYQ